MFPKSWSEHLIWVALLAYVLSRGPGALALDHPVARRFATPSAGLPHQA